MEGFTRNRRNPRRRRSGSQVEADAAVVPALHVASEAAEGGLLQLWLRDDGRRAVPTN
jgi:hypothetical protein